MTALLCSRLRLALTTALIGLVSLAPLSTTLAAEPPAEQLDAEGVGRIAYFGYADCLYLENEQTRVVITLHGARVLEYAINGNNAIFLDQQQQGHVFDLKNPAFDPTGGRFDLGPERVIPKRRLLWVGKWQGEIIGPRAVRLTSQEDPATGVRLTRDFVLAPNSSTLSVTQTIHNVSDQPVNWSFWSRTLVLGGGIVLIPLTDNSALPKQYVRFEPGNLLNFKPKDPAVRQRDNFLEIVDVPLQPKLGFDSNAGWFAYLMANNLLMVKKYPVYPDKPYLDLGGMKISVWFDGKRQTELEAIGPNEAIQPGETGSFTETWMLLPYPFPKDQSANLREITRLVQAE